MSAAPAAPRAPAHRPDPVSVLDRACARLATGLAWLAGGFLVVATATACLNMILRASTASLQGTVEIVGFSGAVLTAFSLALTQRQRGHIAVAIFFKRFGRRTRRVLDTLTHLASAAFFGLCTLEVGRWGATLAETGELAETLRVPYHPVVWAVAVGCGVMTLTLLVDALKAALGRDEGL
ncbi:MAG: TRAP transporter small permease [Desulfovibrionaceae bacterium]